MSSGDVLIHHAVYALYLPNYLVEPAVKVVRIHALFHAYTSIGIFYIQDTTMEEEVSTNKKGTVLQILIKCCIDQFYCL